MVGADGENDLSFGTKHLRAAIGRAHHAPRAAALQQDLRDDGVGADAEIGSRPRGIDERVRGARPLAPVHVPVEGAEPFLLVAVHVLRHPPLLLAPTTPDHFNSLIPRAATNKMGGEMRWPESFVHYQNPCRLVAVRFAT